jgi:hypothetical protein
VPLDSLTIAPFNLGLGEGIFAKIIATNEKGDSFASQPGNVATIIEAPDAPINLAEDTIQRSPTQLALTWIEGATNGGSSVTEYRVNMA